MFCRTDSTSSDLRDRRRRTQPGMANNDSRQDGTVSMHQTPFEKQTEDIKHAAQLHTHPFFAELLVLLALLLLPFAALPKLPVTEIPGQGQK